MSPATRFLQVFIKKMHASHTSSERPFQVRHYFYKIQAPSRITLVISMPTRKTEHQLLIEACVEPERLSILPFQQGLSPLPGKNMDTGVKRHTLTTGWLCWACSSHILFHTESSDLRLEKMREKHRQAETRAGQEPCSDSSVL